MGRRSLAIRNSDTYYGIRNKDKTTFKIAIGRWSASGYDGLRTNWLPTFARNPLSVSLPLWLLMALFGSFSWFSRSPARYRHKRKKLGLCVKCGYDLRGSTKRCPECNTPLDRHRPLGGCQKRRQAYSCGEIRDCSCVDWIPYSDIP